MPEQLFDGDTVNTRRALVAHHCTQHRFYVVRCTDRLHEMLCECRAFGFGRRRDRFDLLRVPARGFTPAGFRQGQLELVWRSHCGHETTDHTRPFLQPLLGDRSGLRPPFLVWMAGLLCPLLTSAPRSDRLAAASVPKDTTQISRSKPDSLHRTPAGFTVLALDGDQLRKKWPKLAAAAGASDPLQIPCAA